jgi:competence protein ComEC
VTATVTFVDVGQGDCTVAADLESRRGMVIDCPEGRSALAVEHLRRQGIEELETVVATHNDLDHLGGLYELATQVPVVEIRFNHATVASADPGASVKLTAALRAFVRLNDGGTQLRPIQAGAEGSVGAVRWRALAPTYRQITEAQGSRNPNHASVVLMLTGSERRFLVAGDADAAVWRDLLEGAADLAADVMLFPHHGAALPAELVEALLDRVGAGHHIVSVGTRNGYGHPSLAVLEALAARSARLMCTQVNTGCLGGAALPQDQARESLPTLAKIGAGLESPASCPCAGTVRFQVDDGTMDVSPSPSEHAGVVAALESPFGN